MVDFSGTIKLSEDQLLDDDTNDAADYEADAEIELAPLRPVASADEMQLQSWLASLVRQDKAAELAFDSLYRTCVSRVYGLVLRIVRNPAIAEEVTEDTFWQIWRQAPRFEPQRGTALAWILTVARSRSLDALRVQKRISANTVPMETLDDVSAQQCDENAYGHGVNDPHDLLEATQCHAQLHHALAQLDALPRQLVAMAFFKGLTHEEIVGATGLPLGTVKSHIRRAMAVLRKCLTPQTVLT